MVPETRAGADHNWPQRMTMTTTNVEILRQGWLDAASALAPGLDTLPELLERGLEAAVLDERLDEQSLLKMVTEVAADAADSLPTDELYFLTRRLQRAVYEYLLSLDALPEPPPRREGANGLAAHDTTLIGAEEVAALGRHTHLKTAEDSPSATTGAPEITTDAPEFGADAPEGTADAPEDTAETSEPEPTAEIAPEPELDHSAADRVEAGLAELDAQLSPEEPEEPSDIGSLAPAEADPETDTTTHLPAPVAHPDPSTRPAFTLFRRTGAAASKAAKPGPATDDSAAVEPVVPPSNGSAASHHEVAAEDAESFVKPKDGFHLSDLTDFTVAQRSEPATDAPQDPASAPEQFEPLDQPSPAFTTSAVPPDDGAAQAAPDPPASQASKGWHLRDAEADQAYDLDSDSSPGDERFETDPEVVEARLEINDRLRRKRCDEAAALLQRLANDVGGRALAELALDAGDRCRALGKVNAALSCYLAASRADPVHETPLLRLADICIDDHDIDLAVSYLERVTRLRRLRNDDKGALKLYRKIVTIAPYRDDILAMLMRAQANGRFEE
jgi:hypothetical protein